VNAKDTDGKTPLMAATGAFRYGNQVSSGRETAVCQLLTRASASINTRSKSGYTALNFASSDGRAEVVAWLLNHGADPNITNDVHGTALLTAVKRTFQRTVEVLLNHHADMRIKDANGESSYSEAGYLEDNSDAAKEIQRLFKRAIQFRAKK
jgi:ankyrin repeat protein